MNMKIGKASDSVIKRSVLRQLHTKRKDILSGAGIGEDCAIFAPSDEANDVMACCMQEAAIITQNEISLEEGDDLSTITIGHLIQRCANNLAADGASPVAVTITLLLPESIQEPWVKGLMAEAESSCKKLSMQIAGGQTRTTPAVNLPYAVVTGFGRARKEDCRTAKAAGPNQDIVISKWIGLEGTALLAKCHREKLLSRYPEYLVEAAASFDSYLSVIPEAATAVKSGVCAMHDASEGGIFATLWELAEGAGVGLTIDLRKLPLRQETVEVCEYLGVNPYELLSGGCLVMTTEDGPGLIAALETVHIPAVIVGRTTDSHDRIIMNDDEIRYMDRPKQDEIYRK